MLIRGNALKWTAYTADQLLTEGDDVYLKAFQQQTGPDGETISATYLPDRVGW